MNKEQEQFLSAEITNGRWAMIGIMAASLDKSSQEYFKMENTSNFDIWQRANGRAAMMIFWAIIGGYTYVKYFT